MAEIGSLAVSLTMDATNFNGTISQVDRNLKAMGGELQAVKAKGADYGKSVEGLSQKQGILNRSFDAASLKLQEQRRRYDELVASGKATDAQIEKQAVAVNKAQTEYNRLEAELKDVTEQLKIQSSQWTQAGQKMQDVGGKIKSVGDGAKDIGKKLTMSVTTPILAMGTAVTKTAMDFEAQMDRVGAIAGATGGEMDKLKKTAMELGASTSKSASEVAIGMENMAAMGFTVNEIMTAMPGIISAAEASGADMAQTADVVASSLNIWGLKATEASKVADILAQTANQSAADITDMQYALKYAGPPAAALGVSLEELSASIGLMSDSGMKGEQAGTTLRSALLSLLDPSEQNSKMMDKMGIQITDAQGNFVGLANLVDNLSKSMEGQTETQKAATLASLVGKEAVSGMLSLMKAGPDTINQLTSSLENSAGASKEAADKMKDNLKGALEELGGSIETASIQLGNVLIPVIRDASQWIQGLVEKFSDLSPEAQKTVLAIGGIAAAAGPLLLIGGTIMSGVGGLVTTVGALSTAIGSAGGLSAVLGSLGTSLGFLAGPVGWTALGVASIGTAAIITAREMGESSIQIEDWSVKVSESTAKAVGGFMVLSDEASGHLTTLSITGQTITTEMASNIITIFAEMGQQVLAEMTADHAERLDAISTFYANSNVLIESEEAEILAKTAEYHTNKEKQITDGNARIAEIMNTASSEKREITLAEQAEINRIHETMKENAIKYMTETELEQKVILETMKNNASEISAQQAAEVVKNSIKQKDEVVAEAQDQYEKAVAEIIKQRDEMGVISGSQAKQLIEDAGKQRDETIKAAEEMHTDVVSEAKKQAKEHVDQVDWTKGEVKSKWEVMKTDVSKKMKEIGSNIKKDWTTAYNDTVTKLTEMVSSGKTKFNELKSSVETKMGEVKTKIETKWGEARNFLEGIDLLQIGKDIVSGLIKGIGDKFGGVQTKIEELAGMIPEWAKKVLGIKSPSRVFAQIGRWISEGWAIGIEEKGNMVNNAVSDIALNAKDIAEHYVDEEKKLRNKANADIAKIEADKASKIATIEKRMHEDVAKVQRSAASKKTKSTLDDAIKIQRIKEDTVAKITKIEETSSKQIENIRSTSTKKIIGLESEMNKTIFEETKRYIDDKKSLEQLSLTDEVRIWEQSVKLFEEGTKERVNAQKAYGAALDAVNKEVAMVNEKYTKEMMRINADFQKEEQRLTDQYEKSLEDRTKALYSFAGMFDEFDIKTEKSGKELLENLGSQVDGFKIWQTEIEKLAKRAIDDGLIKELTQMGPKALSELIALNSLTDTQLSEYSALYKEKSELARTQAEEELVGMKDDTAKQIDELRKVANTELSKLETDWVSEIKGITGATKSEMSSLENIGRDAVQGLINGMNSMHSDLQATANAIAETVNKTVKDTLKVKSPSRVMIEVGKDVGRGLVIGLENSHSKVSNASKLLANSIVDQTSESYQKLIKLEAETLKKREEIQKDFLERREALEKESPGINTLFASQLEAIKQDYAKHDVKLPELELKRHAIANLKFNFPDLGEYIDKLNEIIVAENEATAQLNEMESQRFAAEKSYMEERVKLNDMSLAEQTVAYKQFATRYAEGSEERLYYDKKIQDSMDLMRSKEIELTKSYNDAISSRSKSLYSFVGIFDEVKQKTDVSGQQLINNLRGQNEAFKDWASNISTLATRGLDEGLLAELQAMGPSAAAEIAALNSLSEDELSVYVNLWKEKSELARSQAELELIGMKEDTERQITEMKSAAELNLTGYVDVWHTAFTEIRDDTTSELEKLVDDTPSIGVNAMQGLMDGLSSMTRPLIAQAQAIADAVSSTIKGALDINSPSRVMRGFGVNIGQGLIVGMDDMLNKVAEGSQRLANVIQTAQMTVTSGQLAMPSTNTVDNRRSFAPTVNVYTTESPEKVMQRELRRMAFQF